MAFHINIKAKKLHKVALNDVKCVVCQAICSPKACYQFVLLELGFVFGGNKWVLRPKLMATQCFTPRFELHESVI